MPKDGFVKWLLTEPFRFRAPGFAAGIGTAVASFQSAWRRVPAVGVWHEHSAVAYAVLGACAEGMIVVLFFAAVGNGLEARERRGPPS